MRGSFFTFRVANTGMHTARANLNVTSHNMANMGIPGFSRQVTVQSALPAMHLRNGLGMYGTGSAVHNVIQMRDQFIDRRFWGQQSLLGEFAVKVPQMSLIEAIFNDLPDNSRVGLLGAFNDFFSRMHEVSRDAHDPTFRLNVVQTGDTLAHMVRANAEALRNQQMDINGEVRAIVTEINSIGQQITVLNRQIRSFEHDGSHANDLRDQRALLIDRLSEFVNVEVAERDHSQFSGIENDRRLSILINGHDFVNHDTVHRLQLVPRTPDQRRNEMDADGLYDITFGSGAPFNIYSRHLRGTLRGLIDMRDGNGGLSTKRQIFLGDVTRDDAPPYAWNNIPAGFNTTPGSPFNILYHMQPPLADPDDPTTWPPFINLHPWEIYPANVNDHHSVATNNFRGIPFYLNRINEMIRVFAGAINEGIDAQGNRIPDSPGHRYGYGLDGQRDRDFFTWTDREGNLVEGVSTNHHLLNAFNFDINQVLMRYPKLLGATVDPTRGESANDVILGFLEVGHFPSLFREGRLIDFIAATSGFLAIDTQQSVRFRNNYTEMTLATQNQRESISGVDMNEELLNMTRFSHLFQVNARMIATMNDVYDTLINRLGIG